MTQDSNKFSFLDQLHESEKSLGEAFWAGAYRDILGLVTDGTSLSGQEEAILTQKSIGQVLSDELGEDLSERLSSKMKEIDAELWGKIGEIGGETITKKELMTREFDALRSHSQFEKLDGQEVKILGGLIRSVSDRTDNERLYVLLLRFRCIKERLDYMETVSRKVGKLANDSTTRSETVTVHPDLAEDRGRNVGRLVSDGESRRTDFRTDEDHINAFTVEGFRQEDVVEVAGMLPDWEKALAEVRFQERVGTNPRTTHLNALDRFLTKNENGIIAKGLFINNHKDELIEKGLDVSPELIERILKLFYATRFILRANSQENNPKLCEKAIAVRKLIAHSLTNAREFLSPPEIASHKPTEIRQMNIKLWEDIQRILVEQIHGIEEENGAKAWSDFLALKFGDQVNSSLDMLTHDTQTGPSFHEIESTAIMLEDLTSDYFAFEKGSQSSLEMQCRVLAERAQKTQMRLLGQLENTASGETLFAHEWKVYLEHYLSLLAMISPERAEEVKKRWETLMESKMQDRNKAIEDVTSFSTKNSPWWNEALKSWAFLKKEGEHTVNLANIRTLWNWRADGALNMDAFSAEDQERVIGSIDYLHIKTLDGYLLKEMAEMRKSGIISSPDDLIQALKNACWFRNHQKYKAAAPLELFRYTVKDDVPSMDENAIFNIGFFLTFAPELNIQDDGVKQWMREKKTFHFYEVPENSRLLASIRRRKGEIKLPTRTLAEAFFGNVEFLCEHQKDIPLTEERIVEFFWLMQAVPLQNIPFPRIEVKNIYDILKRARRREIGPSLKKREIEMATTRAPFERIPEDERRERTYADATDILAEDLAELIKVRPNLVCDEELVRGNLNTFAQRKAEAIAAKTEFDRDPNKLREFNFSTNLNIAAGIFNNIEIARDVTRFEVTKQILDAIGKGFALTPAKLRKEFAEQNGDTPQNKMTLYFFTLFLERLVEDLETKGVVNKYDAILPLSKKERTEEEKCTETLFRIFNDPVIHPVLEEFFLSMREYGESCAKAFYPDGDNVVKKKKKFLSLSGKK